MLFLIDLLILGFFSYIVSFVYIAMPQYAIYVYSLLVLLGLLYYKLDKVDLALSESRRERQIMRCRLKHWYFIAGVLVISGVGYATFLYSPKEKPQQSGVSEGDIKKIKKDLFFIDKKNDVISTKLKEVDKGVKKLEDKIGGMKVLLDKADLDVLQKVRLFFEKQMIKVDVPETNKKDKKKDKDKQSINIEVLKKGIYRVDGQNVGLKEMSAVLREMIGEYSDKKVFLKVGEDSEYRYMLDVLDICKKMGLQPILITNKDNIN